MSFYQLPPPPNCCQKCAVEHDSDQPHNPQSFFYATWFFRLNNRSHTWADAMMHCSEEIKAPWLEYLARLGVDPNSTNISGGVTQESVDRAVEAVFNQGGGHE